LLVGVRRNVEPGGAKTPPSACRPAAGLAVPEGA
jgi:hypothetical protein